MPIGGRLADLQELFALNEVGSWLWSRLDGSKTLDDLVVGVTREFEVGEAQAREDAKAFLDELLKAGLVTESTSEKEA